MWSCGVTNGGFFPTLVHGLIVRHSCLTDLGDVLWVRGRVLHYQHLINASDDTATTDKTKANMPNETLST